MKNKVFNMILACTACGIMLTAGLACAQEKQIPSFGVSENVYYYGQNGHKRHEQPREHHAFRVDMVEHAYLLGREVASNLRSNNDAQKHLLADIAELRTVEPNIVTYDIWKAYEKGQNDTLLSKVPRLHQRKDR